MYVYTDTLFEAYKMHDDCPICMESYSDDAATTIQPCGHLFCRTCIARTFKNNLECPLCRGVPSSVTTIGTGTSTGTCITSMASTIKTVLIKCVINPQQHAGITLADAAHGVRVLRTNVCDAARASGIQINDVIVCINGLPCTSHYQVSRVWNRLALLATQNAEPVVAECSVVRKKTRMFTSWRRYMLQACR